MDWKSYSIILGALAILGIASGELQTNGTQKQLASVRVFQLQGLTRLEGVKAKRGRKGVFNPSKWTPKSALLIVSNEDFSSYSELGMMEWFEKLGMKLVTATGEQSNFAAELYNSQNYHVNESQIAQEHNVSFCDEFLRNVSLTYTNSTECLDEKQSVNETNSQQNSTSSSHHGRCKRIRRPWRQFEDDPYFNKRRRMRHRHGGRFNQTRPSRLSWEHHVFINWEKLTEDEVLIKWETVRKCERILENAQDAEEEENKRKRKHEKKKEEEDDDNDKDDNDDDDKDKDKKKKKKDHGDKSKKKDEKREHGKDKGRKDNKEEKSKDGKKKEKGEDKKRRDSRNEVEENQNEEMKKRDAEQDKPRSHQGNRQERRKPRVAPIHDGQDDSMHKKAKRPRLPPHQSGQENGDEGTWTIPPRRQHKRGEPNKTFYVN